MLLLVVCLLGCIYSAHSTVTVVNSWPGGFEGWISISTNQEINGWQAELRMNQAISNMQIWNADYVDTINDGKTVIIKDKGFNSNVKPGVPVEMNFVAETTGSDGTTGFACFVGQCDGSNTPSPGTPSPGGTTSKPGDDPYNYNEVIEKSILFYEAQRSGYLPGSNRIPYRGDSALGDRGNSGEDLTGGWYDAGDFVKFGFPMASTVTTLAWGMVEFEDGYQKAGQMDWALDSIKWPLDYFIKAHPSPNVFYGQVGDGHIDHAYWGRPEDMNMERPAWAITTSQPGSELAGETASAMAAGSMVFRKAGDDGYADTLLSHARDLYNFAYSYRGKYTDAIPADDFYGSWAYEDELCLGAAWLYYATGEQDYLTKAEEFLSLHTPKFYSWDDKAVACQLLMYKHTNRADVKSAVEGFLRQWFPGGSIPYTPKGLAWGDMWGANRYASNSAFVALLAAKMDILPSESINFARSQVHYILGDNGRSYVVGFGNNPPQRPHHGSSSCPDRPASCGWDDFYADRPNPQILYGALVGGPDVNDWYQDDRKDYVMNEVATYYNAGFQSAVAGLNAL